MILIPLQVSSLTLISVILILLQVSPLTLTSVILIHLQVSPLTLTSVILIPLQVSPLTLTSVILIHLQVSPHTFTSVILIPLQVTLLTLTSVILIQKEQLHSLRHIQLHHPWHLSVWGGTVRQAVLYSEKAYLACFCLLQRASYRYTFSCSIVWISCNEMFYIIADIALYLRYKIYSGTSMARTPLGP